MEILIDSNVPSAQAFEILGGLAAIARADADRERLDALRAAYWQAEEAANVVDAAPEVVVAWKKADGDLQAALRELGLPTFDD